MKDFSLVTTIKGLGINQEIIESGNKAMENSRELIKGLKTYYKNGVKLTVPAVIADLSVCDCWPTWTTKAGDVKPVCLSKVVALNKKGELENKFIPFLKGIKALEYFISKKATKNEIDYLARALKALEKVPNEQLQVVLNSISERL